MNTANVKWKSVWGNTNIIVKVSNHKVLGKRLFMFTKDKTGTLHGVGYYSLKDDKFHRLKD